MIGNRAPEGGIDLRWIVAGVLPLCALFVAWATRVSANSGIRGLGVAAAGLVAPIALGIAFVRPLLFPYGLYAAFIPFDAFAQLSPGSVTVTRIIGLFAGAALLIHAIRTRRFVAPPAALWWLAALLAWVLFSVLWSSDPLNAPVEAVMILQIAVLYTIVAVYGTRATDISVICNAIILGGVASAFLGIYEFHHQSIAQASYVQNFARLNIQVGDERVDPNLYSDALILPFGIMAARWLTSRDFVRSLIPLATLLLFIVAIDIAASREAMIALGLEMIALAIILRAWRRLIPLALAAIAGLAAIPNVVVRALQDQGNGGSGRTSIWRVGWEAFRQHPLIGSGSGSFADVYDQWYLRVFQPYEAGWHRASHDIILHFGVEFGIIGLILVGGCWLAQWRVAREIPQGCGFDDLRAALLATIVALAFVSLVVDAFDTKFLWLAFALIAQLRAATLGFRVAQ